MIMKKINFKAKNNLVEIYIISVFLFYFAAYKALRSLLEIFSYGIYKKEILSNKSNLGFDLKIRIK